MSTPITFLRGETFSQSFDATFDDAPYDQTGRTLTASFYYRGQGGADLVLEIVTDVDAESGDDRLVVLEAEVEDGPRPTWELRLGALDTAALAPGPYRWEVRTVSNTEPDDATFLVPPSNCYVTDTGVVAP